MKLYKPYKILVNGIHTACTIADNKNTILRLDILSNNLWIYIKKIEKINILSDIDYSDSYLSIYRILNDLLEELSKLDSNKVYSLHYYFKANKLLLHFESDKENYLDGNKYLKEVFVSIKEKLLFYSN